MGWFITHKLLSGTIYCLKKFISGTLLLEKLSCRNLVTIYSNSHNWNQPAANLVLFVSKLIEISKSFLSIIATLILLFVQMDMICTSNLRLVTKSSIFFKTPWWNKSWRISNHMNYYNFEKSGSINLNLQSTAFLKLWLCIMHHLKK